MVLSAALMLLWASDRIFALDEWDYFTQRGDWTAVAVLRPSNGHLIALPLVAYKTLLSVFGATSHLPFTLLSVAMELLVGGLLYVYCARRIGNWAALIPAVLVLFLGSGWEVMVNTAAVQNQFGIAAGLGMLLCLDREDQRGDVGAVFLLAASLASFTIGVAFAAAAAVRVIVDAGSRPGLKRLWVVIAPSALYVVWFVWARKYHQGAVEASAVGSIPSAVFDQLAAILASLTGLFRATGPGDQGLLVVTSRVMFLVFVLLGAAAWRFTKGPKPSAALWTSLTALAAYLFLIAIGLNELRGPDDSRYAFMGAVLLLAFGADALSGLRLDRRWGYLAGVLLTVSLVGNIAQIHNAGKFFEEESDYNRAELAALEITRPDVSPDFVVEQNLGATILPHRDLVFFASDYFAAADRFGSPADSETELAAEPEEAREAADTTLDGALGLTVNSGPAVSSAPAAAPAVTGAINAQVNTDGSCVVAKPQKPGELLVTLQLPPGGMSYSSSAGAPDLSLRRFADAFTIKIPSVPATGVLEIPTDLSKRPWQAAFAGVGTIRVCGG